LHENSLFCAAGIHAAIAHFSALVLDKYCGTQQFAAHNFPRGSKGVEITVPANSRHVAKSGA
jgi:hypothetical protein